MQTETINITALETAVTALAGTNGANIIRELYTLLDNAEKLGYEAGYRQGSADFMFQLPEDVADEEFNRGYDFGYAAASSVYEVPADCFEPLDEDFYDALAAAYGDDIVEAERNS